MTIQKLKSNIKMVSEVQIYNESQSDMIKEFGIFVTYCLFWLPKYDRWYWKRVREIKRSKENGNN